MTFTPKFEDYKAPWEVDSTGADIAEDDQKLDAGRVKKHLWNLLGDKGRLQTTIDSVTVERDKNKADLDAISRKGEGADDAAKREHKEALAAAELKGDLKALRLEVALDIEGITPAQAKRIASRLTGTTADELKADAAGLAQDFGIGAAPAGDGEERLNPGGKPQRELKASGDPKGPETKLPDPNDPAAMAKLFPNIG